MANHFLVRYADILRTIDPIWQILYGRDLPVIYFTFAMIADTVLEAEHRGQLNSVFKEMEALPKCQVCGFVSELCFISFVRFFPCSMKSLSLFIFTHSTNTLSVTTTCGSQAATV